jgi:hypothetical protein
MLRIATLNQYQPGLSSDDLSDVGQPVITDGEIKGYKVNVWEALRGWGQRLYRKADIVFLTEVRHAPHVRFLAQPDISGLPYYAMLKEKEIRQFGEYRTRRLLLKAWDKLKGG